MTLTTTTSSVGYTGNGATTEFPFSFIIPDTASLVVKLVVIATGVETTVSSGDYTVTGLGEAAGGTVTYPLSGSPLASTHKLFIVREVPNTQTVNITNQTAFNAEVVMGVWDRLTMQIQQVVNLFARVPRLPITTALTAPTLPEPEAGKALVANAGATGWDNGPSAADISSAQTNAEAAAASAAEAALYEGPWLNDVPTLIADTTLTYTTVVAGDIIRTRKDGFIYEAATSSATDNDITTAGGIKLYVLPSVSGHLNPMAFGATGDGTTDDTTAVQAAIAKAASGGYTVLVDRTHLCGQLTVSASIVGADRKGGLTRKLATTGAWFNVTASDVEISGLRLLGQNVAARGIEVDGQSSVVIRNNYVRNIGEYFVHFNGANRLVVEGNDCADGSNGIANLLADDVVGVESHYVSVIGNRIHNIPGSAIHFAGNQQAADPNFGITSPLVRYSTIADNIISSVDGNGILCQAWDIAVNANVITDTGSVGGNQGIVCQGRYISVVGNTLKSGAGVGIDMGGCRYATVSGNVVDSFSQIGIEIQSCESTTCTGNTVVGCGNGLTGESSAGIAVAEGFFGAGFTTTSIVVSGNTVGSAATQGEYGVAVGADCTEVIVTGNSLILSGSIAPKFIAATAKVLYYGNLEDSATEDKFTLLGADPEIRMLSSSGNTDFIIRPQGTGVLRIMDSFPSATTPANFVAQVSIEVKDASGSSYFIPAKFGSAW